MMAYIDWRSFEKLGSSEKERGTIDWDGYEKARQISADQKLALGNLLESVEAEKDKDEQWKILQIIRELARKIREGELGFSGGGPLWAAALSAAIVVVSAGRSVTVSIAHDSVVRRSVIGEALIRVVRKHDARRFKMRWVRAETAPGRSVDFTLNFCEPMDLGPGETLIFLAYRENGSCIEALEPHEEVGYVFERKPDGWPTLAPNCRVNPQIFVECSPEIEQANFSEKENYEQPR